MHAAATALAQPAPESADGAAVGGWAQTLLERQIEILGELAEIGLETARAIQALAGEPSAHPQVVAMSYARVARAVRQTVMLSARLIEDLIQYREKGAAAAEQAEAEAEANADRLEQSRARKAGVVRIVRRVAEETEGLDPDTVWALAREAKERLEHDDIYGDVLARPISEIVSDICSDLGLEPHWAYFFEESWAQKEIATGAPGEALARLIPEEDDEPAPAARPQAGGIEPHPCLRRLEARPPPA